MTDLVRDPRELCELLELDFGAFRERHLADIAAAHQSFRLRVPRSFVARMKKGQLDDPLLLQVLPQAQELLEVPGYTGDPLEEAEATASPGIIQKYQGRVLLMVSSACAIHCRYCFRRHFPYDEHRQSRNQWQEALASIAADSSIREVIFSGGDPLSASDRQLSWFVEQIEAIPHVSTLRIHTRLPIVIPDRVDQHCLEWMTPRRLKKVVVLHSNHAQEIDAQVGAAIQRMQELGIVLLNQAVLLKGVNDSAETLADLSHALFQNGVLPYYLHLLDKVAGAHHFDVDLERALALHGQLKSQLPGYLVPKLAREEAGAKSKTVLG